MVLPLYIKGGSKRSNLYNFILSCPDNTQIHVTPDMATQLGYCDMRKLIDALRRLSDRTDVDFNLDVWQKYRAYWVFSKVNH